MVFDLLRAHDISNDINVLLLFYVVCYNNCYNNWLFEIFQQNCPFHRVCTDFSFIKDVLIHCKKFISII